MPILYEEVRLANTKTGPLYPVMLQFDTQTISVDPYVATAGLITAIRVQDVARDIWYSWDVTTQNPQGSWNNAGGGGKNAPVGETPRVTPGANNLYVAFYATNMGQSGNLTLTLKNSGNYILQNQTVNVASGASAGIEWTGNMPSASYGLILSVTP